jgi:hypothetical protein
MCGVEHNFVRDVFQAGHGKPRCLTTQSLRQPRTDISKVVRPDVTTSKVSFHKAFP